MQILTCSLSLRASAVIRRFARVWKSVAKIIQHFAWYNNTAGLFCFFRNRGGTCGGASAVQVLSSRLSFLPPWEEQQRFSYISAQTVHVRWEFMGFLRFYFLKVSSCSLVLKYDFDNPVKMQQTAFVVQAAQYELLMRLKCCSWWHHMNFPPGTRQISGAACFVSWKPPNLSGT